MPPLEQPGSPDQMPRRRSLPSIVRRLADLLLRSRESVRLRLDSGRLYRVLVETAPDAVFLFDRNGIVRFANSRAAALLRCRGVEELSGRDLESIVDGADIETFRSQMAVGSAPGGATVDLFAIRSDGSRVPVESSSAFVEDEGSRLRHSLVVWRDVSRRREREEKIRSLSGKLSLIARLAQTMGSLEERESFAELAVDSTFAICPGALPCFWLADCGTLRCERGVDVGSHAAEGGTVLETFRENVPVLREEGGLVRFCVPIRDSEGAIGVLELTAPDAVAFDESSREALSVFADQLGLNIQNARLYGAALERLERLEALRTIDRAITSAMRIDSVLGVIVEETRQRLEVDAVDILLYDPEGSRLRSAARSGFRSEALAHTHLALGQGYSGRVAAERNLMVVPSIAEDSEAFATSPSFAEEGFVAYAGAALVAKGELQGVLEVFHRSPLEAAPEWRAFFEALAGQAAIAVDNASLLEGLQRANAELREAYEGIIQGWAEALELRDRETEGHCRRVTEASVELARRFGIGGKELEVIRHGALLHDIGKMGIPDAVLLKPGPLDAEETAVMRRHTVIGRDLLASLKFLEDAAVIPYCHHERWDGSGYPRGLAGEAIPFAARLFSVVDVWDALRSDRPYHSGWTEERALAYIEERSGTEFDPAVVRAFLAVRRSGAEGSPATAGHPDTESGPPRGSSST